MERRRSFIPLAAGIISILLLAAGCNNPAGPGDEVTAPADELSVRDLRNLEDMQFIPLGLLFTIASEESLKQAFETTGTVTITPTSFGDNDSDAIGSIVVTRRTLTEDGVELSGVELDFNNAGDSEGTIDTPVPFITGSTLDDGIFPDVYIARGTVIVRRNVPEAYTSTYVYNMKTTKASAAAQEITTGTITVNGEVYDAAEVEAEIDGLPADESGTSFNFPGLSR